jgi:hypothetical protein
MAAQLHLFCQRWRARRESYRPAGEPIETSRYGVELLGYGAAHEFVTGHHYSGSYPADRLRVGLFRGAELVGVAVFSVPANNRVIPAWTGLEPCQGVELGRLVLLDDVPANGETWFLGRAFEVLRSELPGVRAVLSYSDPVQRRSSSGVVVLPGHVGTIYQAHNGRYLGRSSRRTLHLDPAGRTVSGRTLSKLRTDDRGAAGAYAQLRAVGAPQRLPLESGGDYVRRVLSGGLFRRLAHPGNHAYVWAVGQSRRATRRAFGEALPFPKRVEVSQPGRCPISGGVQCP